MPDYRRFARQVAVDVGLDPDIFERQIDTESSFDPDAYNAASGTTGIAQIIPQFHPLVNARDPEDSLRYAARWVPALLDANGGSYARALASYNWGRATSRGTPSATARSCRPGTASARRSPPRRAATWTAFSAPAGTTRSPASAATASSTPTARA